MADYISKKSLYEKTAEWESKALEQVVLHAKDSDPTEWKRWSTILTERTAFKHDVMDAPAADVVPVRHGEWIYHQEASWKYECPFCGSYFPGDWNYCADCGAAMTGGADDA